MARLPTKLVVSWPLCHVSRRSVLLDSPSGEACYEPTKLSNLVAAPPLEARFTWPLPRPSKHVRIYSERRDCRFRWLRGPRAGGVAYFGRQAERRADQTKDHPRID